MNTNVLRVEGGLIVIARILCISDLHKRYKDSTSIKGQLEVQLKIQEDLIAFNKANGITHNIILGDWYDRGFHGLGQAYGSMEMDRRLSASVNGNVYLCVGNHFYLERDENPEMYIIQPNEFIKPQMSIPVPDKPIFKLVQKLEFGPVQIDFFHYNKLNKNYVAPRNPDCKFHIGIYHDDTVLPGWVREMEGFTGSASQAYFNEIYANIDFAVHGHIHSKVGMCNVELRDGRKVPMCIPGSLGITQNKDNLKHKEVQLPIIDINDDYSVSIKLATFATHLEDLRFFKVKKKAAVTDITDGKFNSDTKLFNTGSADLKSLSVYMTKKGYSNYHLNLINAAKSNSLDIASAVRIIVEADEINEC